MYMGTFFKYISFSGIFIFSPKEQRKCSDDPIYKFMGINFMGITDCENMENFSKLYLQFFKSCLYINMTILVGMVVIKVIGFCLKAGIRGWGTFFGQLI